MAISLNKSLFYYYESLSANNDHPLNPLPTGKGTKKEGLCPRAELGLKPFLDNPEFPLQFLAFPFVIPASPFVIPASLFVILVSLFVIPVSLFVIPAKAGIHLHFIIDPCFRRGDEKSFQPNGNDTQTGYSCPT